MLQKVAARGTTPNKKEDKIMNGIIKCIETGFEYGYSSLEQREWIIAGIVEQGYTWSDRPVYISVDDF